MINHANRRIGRLGGIALPDYYWPVHIILAYPAKPLWETDYEPPLLRTVHDTVITVGHVHGIWGLISFGSCFPQPTNFLLLASRYQSHFHVRGVMIATPHYDIPISQHPNSKTDVHACICQMRSSGTGMGPSLPDKVL